MSDGMLELYSYDANGAKTSDAILSGSGLDFYGNDRSYATLGAGVLALDDGAGSTSTYAADYMDITTPTASLSLSPEMLIVEEADIPTVSTNNLTVGEKAEIQDLEVYNQIDCGALYIGGEEVTPTPPLPTGVTDTIFADGNILYFEDGILVGVDSE